MNKMKRRIKHPMITEMKLCTHSIDSEYGIIKWENWCERELFRLMKIHPKCHVVYKEVDGYQHCGIKRK